MVHDMSANSYFQLGSMSMLFSRDGGTPLHDADDHILKLLMAHGAACIVEDECHKGRDWPEPEYSVQLVIFVLSKSQKPF